jgi:nicotinamidase-related amidase
MPSPLLTALLVIDVQKGMFAFPDFQPYDGLRTVERTAGLVARARAARAPVFFVKHDSGPEGPLALGTPNHEIVDALAPMPTDQVFTKTKCSSFLGTGLGEALRTAGVGHIIITGMQTDFCVDTAVRVAIEQGFTVTMPEGCNTTFDNEHAAAAAIIAHHQRIWSRQFGPVVSPEAVDFGGP